MDTKYLLDLATYEHKLGTNQPTKQPILSFCCVFVLFFFLIVFPPVFDHHTTKKFSVLQVDPTVPELLWSQPKQTGDVINDAMYEMLMYKPKVRFVVGRGVFGGWCLGCLVRGLPGEYHPYPPV